MLLPDPRQGETGVRLVIAVVVVAMALQLLVVVVGTGLLSNAGVVVAKIWEVQVHLFQAGFWGHQPVMVDTAVGADNNERNIGKKNIAPGTAAENPVWRSETTGDLVARSIGKSGVAAALAAKRTGILKLDHTSPPAVGVYEPGRSHVQWTSASSPLPCNILYIKVHKCASSTAGGVARRIAALHHISGVDSTTLSSRAIKGPEPAVAANHGNLSRKWNAMKKLHMRSFLWTMIRLPVSRCMSFYYFQLRDLKSKESRRNMPGKVQYLRQSCNNYVFNYLISKDSDTPQSLVGSALVGGVYGFIGLAERYDESMVMLSYLLRIPLSDVLYLKSKESTMKGLVKHPSMAEEALAVRSFAVSAAFNRSNAKDYALHAAASKELDRRWRSKSKI